MEAPVNYFSELYRVDVSKHVERKNGFSYVSWPFAVAELRKRHPDATWEVVRFNGLPYLVTPAGHFVEVAVTVGGVRLSQIHPVLNHANKPIKDPDAFAINTSIQRALVKAIALHGLGLFVYAGEDLPEGEPPSSLEDQLKASIDAAKAKKNPTADDLKAMDLSHGPRKLAWDSMNSEWQAYLAHLAKEVEACMPDVAKAQDRIDIEELEQDQLAALAYKLSSKTNAAVKTASMERNTA